MAVTLTSGDGNDYTLTVNNLSIETDFTLTIENHITLIVNGTTLTNGGVIDVKDSASILFNNNVTMSGAGATLNLAPIATIDIVGTFTFTGGVNILNIGGLLTMDDLIASGGQQQLNILPSGEVVVRNNSSFSESATFDINNNGAFTVGGNMTVSGGANGTIDGNLNVSGTLLLQNNVALTGTGNVTASIYDGTGTIFGSDITTLSDGTTYTNSGSNTAVPVSTLPISLISFNGFATENNVQLTWTTATEENNNYFTLERSTDGTQFEIIGTINGAGNSTNQLDYSFTDDNPLIGTTYYRLKQTDFDGQFEYFNVVSVNYYYNADFQVYPNPARNEITVDFGGSTASSTIQILNLTGQVVKTISTFQAQQNIDISDLVPGNYLLTITNGTHPLVKHLVIE